MQALVVLDVASVRHRDDRQLGRQVVQTHADGLVGIEGERPDVAVLAVELGAQEIDEGVRQRLGGIGERHVEKARRLEESLEVLERAEEEELRLLGVPVAAQAGEDAGAVVQAVRQDADARFRIGNDPSAKERVSGEGHGRPPSTDSCYKSTFDIHF